MDNFLYSQYRHGKRIVRKILGIKIKSKVPTDYAYNILKITPRTFLPFLEIHIAEHCNLNCQCCTHFSPLAEKRFLPLKDYEKDIKRLAELNLPIEYLHILGGEPLLNPDCLKYLEIARKYLPKMKIRLITNGILLPSRPDSFYEALAKNDIILAPTKYPIKIDWDKVQEKCEKYSVKLCFYNNSKVIKTSYKLPMDIEGRQDSRVSFINCSHANGCFQLKKGRIYTCCIGAYIEHFNKYFNKNLEDSEKNSIDIYKVPTVGGGEEILKFLANPIPLCRYCDVKNHQSGLKWKPSARKLEEWIQE